MLGRGYFPQRGVLHGFILFWIHSDIRICGQYNFLRRFIVFNWRLFPRIDSHLLLNIAVIDEDYSALSMSRAFTLHNVVINSEFFLNNRI
jgi:hypothetical protein